MKLKLLFFKLMAIFMLLGCSTKSENKEIISPNGTLRLKAYVKNNFVFLEIYTAKGKKLYVTNTNASNRHNWNIEWYNNDTILLRSSDIGNYFWKKTKIGDWEKVNALISFSPDKKMMVKVNWNYKQKKHVILRIGKPTEDEGISVLYTIKPTLKVSDLIGCVKWSQPNVISLKGDSRTLNFQKQKDGSWQQF
jgi:outer membrane biogenesis lipoprotein LolB